jgi:hypothetical protein
MLEMGVWWLVFLTCMGLCGRMSRNIANKPIEEESVAGATRQSLLGALIIAGSVIAAFGATRVIFA